MPICSAMDSAAMAPFGQLLQNEREKRSLSQAAICAQTKIPVALLEAIERGDHAQIANAFFYRSFARQFAAAVGLDYSVIQESVEAVASTLPAPRVPGQDIRSLGIAPLKPRRQSPWSWASPVASLFAMLVLCSGLYAFFDRIETQDLSPFKDWAAQTSRLGVVSLESAWSRIATSVQPAVATEPAAVSSFTQVQISDGTASAGGPISLSIAAVEKAWLSIDSDGRHVYTGLLEPADTKQFEGKVTARIRTGNAGGLEVTFNGKQLGLLGQRGQVRTVLFTRDQYEILQPALTSRLRLMPAVTLSGWSR